MPERATRSGEDAVEDGLRHALAAVGDRWSLQLVAALLDGPARFGELHERLPGIAPNILTQRVRALESIGVVLATPYSERPLRFLYELTAAGRELGGALRLLTDWGQRHRAGGEPDPPRHAACGTPLELRWHCPLCDETVEAPGAEDDAEGLYLA